MIKVILVDDEKHALITMEHALKNFDQIEVIGKISDSRQVKDEVERLKPDLVFMDIEMPYINGLEVLKSFQTVDFKVVFTTAYNQYAIQALRLNAFDYLLKPLDLEEVEAVILKYEQHKIETSENQITHLNQFDLKQMLDTIALSTAKGLQFILIEDMMYLIAENSYTFVYTQDGNSYLVSKSLANFEEVLSHHPVFFRIHKSSMINLKFIKQYIKGEGGELLMQDGKRLVLSRTKKQDFLNLFKRI